MKWFRLEGILKITFEPPVSAGTPSPPPGGFAVPPDLVPELSNPHSTRVHTNFYTKKSPKDLFHPEASNLEFLSPCLHLFLSQAVTYVETFLQPAPLGFLDWI